MTTTQPALLAEVTRGRYVESRHRGHIVAVDLDGRVLLAVGDPDAPIFPRSALKPLQALAGLVRGTDRLFGLTDAELAVICGSHRAEPRHRVAVRSILNKIGASEQDLRCGPHAVPDIPSRDDLIRRGQEPTAIYSNCSGKHTGMLAFAQALGAPMDGYWDVTHPVQREIQQLCNSMCCENGAASLEWAVDGCAVPTYLLTLRQLARGFAVLSAPARPEHLMARRISLAMMAEPEMVGGISARDSILMQSLPGIVVAKTGAEGVQAMGLFDRGIGVVIKVEDGAERALWPLCISVLRQLGALPRRLPAPLAAASATEIVNTRHQQVGSINVRV